MFERAHHRRIASILEALDADRLAAAHCLFGGGTAIALLHGEYRESVDIVFLVSDLAGYRGLRQRLNGPLGIGGIVKPGASLKPLREVRADQYGIRTMLQVDDIAIKFEIVLEARISLAEPGATDRICGVATLAPLDRLATKLLANADRWRDDAVMSRDLIDLAMMQPSGKQMKPAIAKAETAYGDSVVAALSKAVETLRERPNRLDNCIETLRMTSVPKALLWKRIKALAA